MLLVLAVFGVSVVVLKVVGALLATIHEVPLLPSLLELIGVGYTAWAVPRYLLFQRDRQALAATARQWKQSTLGDRNPFALAAAPARPELPAATAAPLPDLSEIPATTSEPVALATPQPEPHELASHEPALNTEQAMAGVVGTAQVLMPLAGVVDLDALRAKLERNLGKVEGEIASLSGRLSNAKFVDKAPADVVQTARDALAEAETQAQLLRDRLDKLQSPT